MTGISALPFPDYCLSLNHFTTSLIPVHVRDKIFELLAVADVNALIDAITPEDFARDERLPYWAELWPSSIALGAYFLEAIEPGMRPSVLEIGCGLGLAGLCAAFAGAKVYMTDYDADALTFARHNCERNLPPGTLQQGLTFGQLDWREDVAPGKFDIVMGSDVLYERPNFAPITRLVSRVLRPGGVAVFTDPHRSTIPDFISKATSDGFAISVMDAPAVNGVRISRIELRHVVNR